MKRLKETYEYAFSTVPTEQRKTAGKICFILGGFTLSSSGITIGAEVGKSMTFYKAVGTCLTGNMLLFLIALFWGILGCRTGYTIVSLIKKIMGNKAASLFSAFVILTMVAWIGINGNLLAKLMMSIFPKWPIPVSMTTVLMIGLGMACSINGWRSLEVISRIFVPFIILLTLHNVFRLGVQMNGFEFLLRYQPWGHMTFPMGVTMIVGNISTFATTIPDICRFAKNERTVFCCVAVCMLMMVVSNLCGIMIVQATGANNLNYGIYLLGLMLPSFIWMVLCACTTQNVNIYFGSLAIQNLVKGTVMEGNISYKTSVLFLGGMSVIAGVTGISQYLRSITSTIALFILPLTGIAIAEVFGKKKSGAKKELNVLLAWLIGILAGGIVWKLKKAEVWIIPFVVSGAVYAVIKNRSWRM